MDRALKELTGENATQLEKIQELEQELAEALEREDGEGEVRTVTETKIVEKAVDTAHFDLQILKLTAEHKEKDDKIQELEKLIEAGKAAQEASSSAQATELSASNEKLTQELEEIKKAHGVSTVEEAVK